MREVEKSSIPGIPLILMLLVTALFDLGMLIAGVKDQAMLQVIAALLIFIPVIFACIGFYTLEPNQAAVLSLFGKYVGTVRTPGLRWNNPFFSKKKVSLRARNFESGKLKVNDLDGSPIEIAAVIVWQVADSAEAVYNVDDYESYVHIQSEAALRAMASSHPYDQHDDKQIALRSHPKEVSEHLRKQLTERLMLAGVHVVEARISHLAYAPEIAQAMLQRQQANAVVAARERIVQGAVGMVQMALDQLKTQGVVELDEERRAAMVSNLLVVLCSDRAAQPVLNTGSLY
jgi:regulator of protease activity HflC (stomatin/prohibitin superfamily)